MSQVPLSRPVPDRGKFHRAPERYGRSLLGAGLEFWPAGGATELLIIGGIHGEEPDTTVLLSRALRTVAAVPPGTAVVTTANPDGVSRGTRGNANGVDLNRNFPTADWRPEPVTHRWGLANPSEVELSPGRAPASEPETVALIALIRRLSPRRIVSLHGHLACIEDPVGSAFGRWAAGRSGLPLVSSVGYATPGSMGTWAAELGIPTITWEFAPEAIETLFDTQLPALIDLLNGDYSC